MFKHISSPNSKSYIKIDNFDENDIQPNALDLRLDAVYSLEGEFSIDNETKIHRNHTKLNTNENGFYILNPGYYSVVLKGIVSISSVECGYIITRSTLGRNGVFIISGLYDSGYTGPMNAGLLVTSGVCKIKQDTRIAQFILVESESLKKYDGDYGLNKLMTNQLYGIK